MEELALIEQRLRELADALAEHKEKITRESQAMDETAVVLTSTAPAQAKELVAQTIESLGKMIADKQGVRVLIAGVHRADSGRVTSWYELFSEKKIERLLQIDRMRALVTLANVERLRLLFTLATGAAISTQIIEESGLSQGQFYYHLRALEAHGLVRKKARNRYEATIDGTSALFTVMAALEYIDERVSSVDEEGS